MGTITERLVRWIQIQGDRAEVDNRMDQFFFFFSLLQDVSHTMRETETVGR